MMTFAARFGHFATYGHHHSTGGWIADMIVRGLVYRSIWAVTRGMPAWMIVGLAATAILAVILWRRT